MNAPVGPPMHIMLIEDDENDVRITRRAIQKGGLDAEMSVTRDGQEALDFLYRRPPFEDARRPDLVLLDINLPKLNGMEVLREIKGDPALRSIPVLMLTTSARHEDVAAAYAHGANAFICKPIRFAKFVEVVRDLSHYWSQVARVPRT
ncbi:MAG: response regulator [Myxococcales bacterium]|jgi:chemotaxis family two-component system response regulator Rcp1|nr:response regulator [Myxococcales bacterium]MCB9534964.1 response regulator [Myxococcales bacterium]